MTTAVCAVILLAYAVAAWTTADRQSPTNDEPFHMASAVAIARLHDYRIDPGDPPLVKQLVGWAGLGVPAKIDTASLQWKQLATDISAGRMWSSLFLYRAPGVDVDALFWRARIVMLAIMLWCGAMVAVVAFRLAGPVSAVAATLGFAAHPLVLAHGPLLKGDLPFTTVMFGLAIATARLAQQLTWPRMVLVGVLCGLGFLVKFSALLLPPIVILVLIARALLASDWPVQSWIARTRGSRLLAAAGAVAVAAGVSYGVLWAGYGFRYRAMPDAQMDLRRSLASLAVAQQKSQSPDAPPMTEQQFSAWRPPVAIRVAVWANDRHLLPEAWVNGMVFFRSFMTAWPHYFCGEVKLHGSLLYFPAALAMKSPISWLLALAGGALALPRSPDRLSAWSLTAGICVIVYGLAPLLTDLQEGLRHLLPLFPFAAVAMGTAAARAWEFRSGRAAVMILASILLVETALSGGDYLAYFNTLAGGKEGGAELLGDSNLDWGQGLPALAAWQKQQPDLRLYLCYSGASDPAHYGIRYINLPGGTPLGPPAQQIGPPGVIAISVTTLQGTFGSPEFDPGKMYAPLKKLPLIDVLDGSIHLYQWNPAKR